MFGCWMVLILNVIPKLNSTTIPNLTKYPPSWIPFQVLFSNGLDYSYNCGYGPDYSITEPSQIRTSNRSDFECVLNLNVRYSSLHCTLQMRHDVANHFELHFLNANVPKNINIENAIICNFNNVLWQLICIEPFFLLNS